MLKEEPLTVIQMINNKEGLFNLNFKLLSVGKLILAKKRQIPWDEEKFYLLVQISECNLGLYKMEFTLKVNTHLRKFIFFPYPIKKKD